jgi:translation initiation factor 2B subunit (eIF-2B alpha/beta/delta family)
MDLESAADELRSDRAHGASYLASRALELLLELDGGVDPADGAACLAGTRPSMAVLTNEMGRLLLAHREGSTVREYVARRLAERRELPGRVAALAAAHLAGTVVAISYSETLALALTATPGGGTVWVMESRPLREGIALALVLRRSGRESILITDAQAALFCGRATCAVAGADSVLANGAVVNKAGTQLLALAARAARIPFYVLAESAKVTDARAADLELEEKEPAELEAPPGLPVRNVYFEVTPRRLISAIFTEDGRLGRAALQCLAREAGRCRRLLAIPGALDR